jgi:hypothetical protein
MKQARRAAQLRGSEYATLPRLRLLARERRLRRRQAKNHTYAEDQNESGDRYHVFLPPNARLDLSVAGEGC